MERYNSYLNKYTMTNEVTILMVQSTERNNAIVGYSIINNQTIYAAVDQLIGIVGKNENWDLSDLTIAIIIADTIYTYITAL